MPTMPDTQIDFSASEELRKWPSLNKERVNASLGARPYIISEGTLEECIQQFMQLREAQRYLYEIHTAPQSDLVGAILSTELVVELEFLLFKRRYEDAIGTAGQIGQWPPVALGRLRIRFSREALPIHQNKAEGSPIRRTFLVRRCTPEQLISAEANADPNFTAFEHRAVIYSRKGEPLAVVHERFRAVLVFRVPKARTVTRKVDVVAGSSASRP
jgi:hypothetical protein